MAPIGKNIVICADGTGNTFDDSVSNITRMIKLLDFGGSHEQVTIYDQGIGTNAKRIGGVSGFRNNILDKEALQILPGPLASPLDPGGFFGRLLGLGFGYGLKTNVGEMWKKLAQFYDGPEDRIYLFGFSRGAFAARALAGLIYRCGLPGKDVRNSEILFDKAYRHYQKWKPDSGEVEGAGPGSMRLLGGGWIPTDAAPIPGFRIGNARKSDGKTSKRYGFVVAIPISEAGMKPNPPQI